VSSTQIIFDYAASAPWEQVISSYDGMDGLEADIESMVDDGATRDECWERIWDHEVRMFESNQAHRERVQALYTTAGVDILSVTPWAHEQSVSSLHGQRRDLARWQSRFDAAPWLHKITTPEDVEAVRENGAVGVILNTQNLGAATDGSLSDIELLYNDGVRIFQLTYNAQNVFGTGCNDISTGGLSKQGQAAVNLINELGGIVDISHCGMQTTLDTIECSTAPVAVTHAACQSVHDHYRGKSDTELERLAENNGYMGIVALPWFISPMGSSTAVETLITHLRRAGEIVGEQNIGIGTDFFPADSQFPPSLVDYYKQYIIEKGFDPEKVAKRSIAGGLHDFETYTDWPQLADAVTDTFGHEVAQGVLGENFLAFWKRARRIQSAG
jgi:membrane dipeptidase